MKHMLKKRDYSILLKTKGLCLFFFIIASLTLTNAQTHVPIASDSVALPSPINHRDTIAQDTVKPLYRSTAFILNKIDTIAHDTIYHEEVRYTRKNWFISISGGIADLGSEQTDYVNFSDRIRPTVGFSVGKWINPVVALRFNMTAAKLQGYVEWNDVTDMGVGNWYFGKKHRYNKARHDYYPADVDGITGAEIKRRYFGKKLDTNGHKGYIYDVPYAGGSFDGVFNLSNLFCHYNPKRLLDVQVYAGVGYTHTFGESDRDQTDINCIMGKTGASLNFRLSNKFGLFLDGQTVIVPEFFDWRVGDGNTMDLIFNYTAGITYNFGKPSQKIVQKQEIKEVIDRVNLLQTPPKVESKVDAKVEKEKLYVAIHFIIDKYDIRPSEMFKLERVADYMYKYPNAKIAVSGYADMQTAYPSYNQKLSERRVNEVVRLLHERYGIAMDRLGIKAFGDKVQPFYENNLNRAVIAFDVEE